MSLTVRRITLWRSEVDDHPGALAELLEPLTAAKASLDIVMGYRVPGKKDRAVLEVWPISGRKLSEAAEGAGLRPSPTPTLLLQGADRPRLGHAIAKALAASGISLSFLVTQVVGRRYSAVLGFLSEEDANRGVGVVRKAAGARLLG